MTLSTTETIIRSLAGAIAKGELIPGRRLEEQDIADRFGVSRTPVREALRELAALGLIEIRGRRGAFVAEASVEELAEMFEAMSEIEGLCARLAAHRMTPFERMRLQEAHRGCLAAVEANDIDAYVRANDAFHHVIYAGTHNRYIEEMARAFRRRTAPFRNTQFLDPERLPHSFKSHENIIDAISGARSEEAYAGMREHAAAAGMRALQRKLAAGENV